jgi:hypothetical protein
VDWRLCGRISDLVVERKLSGARGEAVLVGTSRAFECARLMVVGMGPSARLEREGFRRFVGDLVGRAAALGFGSVGFALPLGGSSEPSLDTAALALVEATVRGSPDVRELVLIVPRGTESGLESLIRDWARPRRDLELDLVEGGPGEARSRAPGGDPGLRPHSGAPPAGP